MCVIIVEIFQLFKVFALQIEWVKLKKAQKFNQIILRKL